MSTSLRKDMLRQRILSAVIGIPIIIGFLFAGKIPFFALIVVLVLAALDEFYSMVRKEGKHPIVLLGMIGGILFCVVAMLKGESGLLLVVTPLLLLFLIAHFLGIGINSLSDMAETFFGSLYIGMLLSYLILIRGMNKHGTILVLILFIATWVYDIMAYAGGKAFGRIKLAPRLSPGKTWEGAIVGALSVILILAGIFFIQWFTLSQRILLGLVIGIVSPLGDLAESKLKREAGVKDTSSRIPGHGGVLDRFDSLLFTAPISYYLFKMIF